ncbi:DUF1266 domain-containing protein [Shewanella algae]|uniref:DUF1266 domain-containing protein n=1 Tax=Shewanella algae TaxID=38313 RepID=UPI0031F594D3
MSTNTLSLHQIWWLTLTSPQISFQTQARGYLNPTSLHAGLEEPNTLEEDWGITDRLSLHQQIASLVNDGSHGHYLASDYSQYACGTSLNWRYLIDFEQSPRRQAEMRYVAATYSILGVGGTRAYDFGRASYLTREGLRFGWVSLEEFDFLHSFIAAKSRYFYRSWEQYTQAWFAGRAIWMFLINEPDTEEAAEALLNGWIARRQRIDYRRAISDKDNPIHQCDWDMELPQLSAPQSLLDLLNQTQD